MKRLKLWFSIALIMLTFVVLSFTSCHHKSGPQPKHSISEYVDSTDLYRVLDQIDNPTFTSIDDALTYHHNELQYREQDSVFFSLTQEEIANIYSVLVKRHEKPTKMAIAAEYMDNVKVYSNLPKAIDMYKQCDPPSDIPNTITVDTVINGKHLKVLREITTNVEPSNEE